MDNPGEEKAVMRRMIAKLVGILVVIVLVIVVAGFWLTAWLSAKPNASDASQYSAVYMATGDIYYGKLSWFPWPHLKNVWFLQRGGPNGQAQFSIAPLTSAFWGPIDEVYLNPRQVIFWTHLRNDSQVAQAFLNPNAFQQQQQPPQVQPPVPQPLPLPPATSTFKGPSGPPPSKR